MTDFRPLAAAYENGQDSNKITLCAITVVLFRREENCLFTTCELRTFELTWTKPLKCYFLGIGEIHKMSHNMVLHHEDITAPIEPLKINMSRRSDSYGKKNPAKEWWFLRLPRDFPPPPSEFVQTTFTCSYAEVVTKFSWCATKLNGAPSMRTFCWAAGALI